MFVRTISVGDTIARVQLGYDQVERRLNKRDERFASANILSRRGWFIRIRRLTAALAAQPQPIVGGSVLAGEPPKMDQARIRDGRFFSYKAVCVVCEHIRHRLSLSCGQMSRGLGKPASERVFCSLREMMHRRRFDGAQKPLLVIINETTKFALSFQHPVLVMVCVLFPNLRPPQIQVQKPLLLPGCLSWLTFS